MILKTFGGFVLVSGYFLTFSSTDSGYSNSTSPEDSQASTRVLSRKKRYLVFPNGSIFQLGYCADIPLIIPQTIWIYGITFGTNWDLPSEPITLISKRNAKVVHRTQRRDLYQKLLPMLNMMGMDGQSCLLRALCESGQRPRGTKGSFLEEILHAIFTLPRSKMRNGLEEDDDFMKYDAAHRMKQDCAEMFPSCMNDLADS